MREETRCRHMGYSFRLTARVLLYASSHREDSTYHGLCYTSCGALAGMWNSSMGPPWRIDLTTHQYTELHLALSLLWITILNKMGGNGVKMFNNLPPYSSIKWRKPLCLFSSNMSGSHSHLTGCWLRFVAIKTFNLSTRPFVMEIK